MKPKNIDKECKHHGLTRHILEGRGAYRCTKCRSAAVQKRRDLIKKMAVDYKGGKCEKCGYDKCIAALEFHHLDPEHKDFAISHNGHTRSWQKVKIEIDKCIMICSNCHKEEHYK